MIPWKDRLYAFLLRRILGPFLETESILKLHQSIQVSLQEGRIVLKDVALNCAYICAKAKLSAVTIRSAYIHSLEVVLSLEEHDDSDSSLPWRIAQLGASVYLVAKIHIDGATIELEPNPSGPPTIIEEMSEPSTVSPEQPKDAAKTMISSYVDAALASLRLTVNLSKITLKFSGKEDHLQVKIKSLSYHDVNLRLSKKDYETVLHKAIDIRRVSFSVGDDKDSTLIALSEDYSQINFRSIKYNNSVHMQNDFQVVMSHKLNILLNEMCLRRLIRLVRELQQAVFIQNSAAPKPIQIAEKSDVSNDEADLKDIDGIVKQYREARMLAERKEIRGGILLPNDDDTSGDITFDAFFDANDQSFYRFSTVLHQSLLAASESGDNNFVHTTFSLHLLGGGCKVSFDSDHVCSQEYLLVSFTDIDVQATFSASSSEATVSVSQMDIEDSQVDLQTGRPNIGRIVHFIYDDHGIGQSEILIRPPCLSLLIKRERSNAFVSSMEASIEQGVELTYRQTTCLHVSRLGKNLASFIEATGKGIKCFPTEMSDEKSPTAEDVSISVNIPSLSIHFPIISPEDFSSLYDRGGVDCAWMISQQSMLSVMFDTLSMEYISHADDFQTTFECNYVFLYATSPDNSNDRTSLSKRLDVISFYCRNDIFPCIPVSLKLSPNRSGEISSDMDSNRARDIFPIVTPISSFKTRQDDEDNVIDKISSPNIADSDRNGKSDVRDCDPQSDMLVATSGSQFIVKVNVPEIIGDISEHEVNLISKMVKCILKDSNESREGNENEGATTSFPLKEGGPLIPMLIALSCDFHSVSLALHCRDPIESSERENENNWHSFVLMVDRFRSHFLIENSTFRHLRVLAHELDFYEAEYSEDSEDINAVSVTPEDRRECLRWRLFPQADEKMSPIFYRSHLFSPLSPLHPSLLVDLVFYLAYDSEMEIQQQDVHITFYDNTYRYDFDSKWIERLTAVVQRNQGFYVNDEFVQGDDSNQDTPCLARVFLSTADCNIDYASPTRFHTASRTILRIGDLRLSSNVIRPFACVQAFSLSFGDLALYSCSKRFPYNFENSRLLGAQGLIDPQDLSLEMFKGADMDVDQNVVLRTMNYRTILTVDSVDAVIAKRNESNTNSDPQLMASLTVGEVRLFACKDSFQHFIDTFDEVSAMLTAVTESELKRLRTKDQVALANRKNFDSRSEHLMNDDDSSSTRPHFMPLDALQKQSALRPAVGTSNLDEDFLLDGYDWTTIGTDEDHSHGIPPGEEQATRWYSIEKMDAKESQPMREEVGFRAGHQSLNRDRSLYDGKLHPMLISHHFQMQPVADPLADGDMGAAKYARTNKSPPVKTRIVIHKLKLKLRFFDGYDWPELLDTEKRNPRKGSEFVIDQGMTNFREMKVEVSDKIRDLIIDGEPTSEKDTKSKLLNDLLKKASHQSNAFADLPLPEEKSSTLKHTIGLSRLARRSDRYFQISASGISLRLDVMEESLEHRLASCMNLKVDDFFFAETLSKSTPTKMVGEWFNEMNHPRDSKDGMLTMKMTTWHAETRVTESNTIANDECQAVVNILPLRCILDQRANRFLSVFFKVDNDPDSNTALPPSLHTVPPPLFKSFRVKPFKMKIDYTPQRVDQRALRDGAVVELINLSPLDAMVLTLDEVDVINIVGWGDVLSVLVRRWIEDICATQLIKFLTNARPFEPITNIGSGAMDLVVLPWEAVKNGESVQRALRAGASSFTQAVTYEALTTTSRISELVARQVSRLSGQDSSGRLLPSRPLQTPRSLNDTNAHTFEVFTRCLQEMTYKVVIVPYREYRRSGSTGAVTSVFRGIPVAVAANTSGAAEALSFALLGARNQLRPDIRKEDETSQRGLHLDG